VHPLPKAIDARSELIEAPAHRVRQRTDLRFQCLLPIDDMAEPRFEGRHDPHEFIERRSWLRVLFHPPPPRARAMYRSIRSSFFSPFLSAAAALSSTSERRLVKSLRHSGRPPVRSFRVLISVVWSTIALRTASSTAVANCSLVMSPRTHACPATVIPPTLT